MQKEYRGAPFAADCFLSQLDNLNLTQFSLANNPENIPLELLIGPDLWLSSLMLRSDYLSTALFGLRLWDSCYMLNDKSLDGLSAIDAKDVADTDLATYKRVPLSSDSTLPIGLFNLVLQKTISDTLKFKDQLVELVPVELNISLPCAPVNGVILPHPDQISINVHFLSELLSSQAIKAAISNARYREHKPSMPAVG